MTVEVLLATFNGEKHLEPLLQSIRQQSYQKIRLLIRDDGSNDNTSEIIAKAISSSSHPIHQIDNPAPKGVIHNFSTLMSEAKAPYVMLADQDDVWLSDKVEKTLGAMQQLEEKWGKETPLLVHSDLSVVDKDLKQIAPSFWDYTAINPYRHQLNQVFASNSATGCTIMINQPLLKLALPIPSTAIMHDWWLLLIAAAFGQVGIIDQSTILYRQHGNNQVGAKHFFHPERLCNFAKKKKSIRDTIVQAHTFYDRYHALLSSEQKKLTEGYISLANSHFLQKRYLLLRHRFFKHTFAQTAGLFLLI